MNNSEGELVWNTESPSGSGYYLATWNYSGGRSRRVSELWFDGTNWWTGREYVNPGTSAINMGECVTEKVVAWIEKPKPFRGRYDVEFSK